MLYVSAATVLQAMAGRRAAKTFVQKGIGHPTGANDADITTRTIQSFERVAGVDYAPFNGAMQTAAIERYRTGKIRKLPDSGFAALKIQGSNDDNGSAGADVVTGGTAAAQ